MKKNKIFMFLLALLLLFTLVGCKEKDNNKDNNNDNPQQDPVKTVTSIASVLTTGKNNDEVCVEGTVYGIISNGFYVADSNEGRIFVVMGDNWTATCKVGDKVHIEGKFGYTSNFPQLKNVSKLEVLSSNNETVAKTEGAIPAIKALKASDRTGAYGNVYTFVATIGKNAAGIITLKDDENNIVSVYEKSNVAALESKMDTRVTLTVIVHNYTEGWNVSFAGTEADIIDTALSFAALKEIALAHIAEVVPQNVFGKLELPTEHKTISYLKYSWAVETENDYISISNNKATVNADDADHEVTLKVTITDGKESETVDYKVVSKALTERTVAELFNGELVFNYSTVIVRALVMGKARNQSESIRSLIVKDMNGTETITFDFNPASDDKPNVLSLTSDEFKNAKVGDEILVMGELRNGDDDRVCVTNITKLTVVSSDNVVDYGFDDAYVLDSKEAYDELGKNYKAYANKLVKFVNPYVNYSTNSKPAATNWLWLAGDKTNMGAGYGNPGQTRRFAFLLACQDENLGGTQWRDAFEFPFANQESQQFDLTCYAYCMYVSDTYLAFIMVDSNFFIASDKMKVELAISATMPASIEKGTIELLTSHELVDGDITWTSDNAAIDAATGVVTEVPTSVTVTLTASYTINGEQYQSEYKVEVMAETPLTIAEVLASEADRQVKTEGIIVGYVGDGNSTASRLGVIIMDPVTKDLVMVDGISSLGGEYGAYKDSEGTLLAIGDKILVKGTYYVDSAAIGSSGPAQTGRHHIEITSNDLVLKTAENCEIVFGDAVVVDSNEDLTEIAANISNYFGKLIKFVGTKDSPIYLGGSSSNDPFNIKVFMYNAVDNNGTKYSGYTFALKNDVNTPNGGSADWYKDLFGFTGPFVAPNASNPAIAWVGELYVVVGYNTSTYFQMSVVNYENCKGTQYLSPEAIGKYLVNGLPSKVASGAWEVALPATHELVEGAITWSTESTLIDLTNNKVGYADEDTEVTITGKYSVDSVEYTVEYKVTVEKSTTKAEVEAVLATGIPTEIFGGAMEFTLAETAEGATDIAWASNSEVIDLTNKQVSDVTEDTEVKLTATYTFRGESTTFEVTITVKVKTISEDDIEAIKAQIATLVGATDGKVTVDGSDAGSMTLPATALGAALTWTSSDEDVITNAGAYAKQYFAKVATLTASFSSGSIDFEVTITPAEHDTVSDVYGATEETTVDVLYAVLIGFTGKSSLTQDGAVRYAYISDGKNYFIVDGNGLAGNLSSNSYKLYADDTALAVGDELVILNSIVKGNKITLTEETTVLVGGKVDVNAEGWFDPQVITKTITNDEELATLVASSTTNGLYKVVATEENPIYFNGHNSSTKEKCLLMFYYLTEEELAVEAKNSCAIMKEEMPYFIGSSFNPTALNIGEKWLSDNFYNGGEMTKGILYNATSCPKETYKFTGTFYFMLQYKYTNGSSSCYILTEILLPGLDLTQVQPAE